MLHAGAHGGQQPAVLGAPDAHLDLAQAPLSWRPDLALPMHRAENMHLARESRKVHANQELTLASGGVADVGSAGRMPSQSTRAAGQVVASTRSPLPDRSVGPKALSRTTPVSTRVRYTQGPGSEGTAGGGRAGGGGYASPAPSPRRPPPQRPTGPRAVPASNKY
jgi:hypothetical protein